LLNRFQNGFNPIWEETAEFRLVYPDLAFVEFRVKSGDYSKTDDHLVTVIYKWKNAVAAFGS
jgi:hypothetical protein